MSATAIEYGLIVALIAVVIITAVSSLGTTLSTKFHNVSSLALARPPGAGTLARVEPFLPPKAGPREASGGLGEERPYSLEPFLSSC